LELVTGGELFGKIITEKRFPEDTARKYFQQICSGLAYCHQNGVAHRDLKPENLLLDKNDVVKITDFGLSALALDEFGEKQVLNTGKWLFSSFNHFFKLVEVRKFYFFLTKKMLCCT
jgi:serine/threonine protein kinase